MTKETTQKQRKSGVKLSTTASGTSSKTQISSLFVAARNWHLSFVRVLVIAAATTIAGANTIKHAIAGDIWLTTGLSGGPKAVYTYEGIIYTPLSGISQTGPVLKLFTKGGYFKYKTHLPDSNLQPVKAKIAATIYGGEAQIGYQYAWGSNGENQGRIGAFAGFGIRDYTLSPHDPGSAVAGRHWGALLSLEGDYQFTRNFGIMTNAHYLTGLDEYWIQARPFYKLDNGLRIGPEVAVFGGEKYEKIRSGLFLNGFELPWKLASGRIFLGAEAGVESNIRDKGSEPYAGVNIGVLY